MGRLREINAKANFAFSPTSTLIATATTTAPTNDTSSQDATLQIYDPQLDKVDPELFTLAPAGSVKIDSRCTNIAWGGVSTARPMGVLAISIDNGNIELWSPADVLSSSSREQALMNTASPHSGTVNCLDFSTVNTNMLVSAGSKGEFFIWNTTEPSGAPVAHKSSRLDDIISVAWNKKVAHIIALGGRSGAFSVYDIKKKTEAIHIATRYPISAITWHPTELTILSTSSADDHNAVVQVWDLRNLKAPKATLSGHEKAVLSLSWASQDADLLLSSGADNRTLLWNPSTAEILAELPASSQWVQKVAWNIKQPQVMANASLDGKISLFSIQDTKIATTEAPIEDTPAGDDFFDSIPKNFQAQTSSFTLKQTPKWLKRPAGARFGAGGLLAQFNAKSVSVEISTQHKSSSAITAVESLNKVLEDKSVAEICDSTEHTEDGLDAQDWEVIKTLTAEHARDALLKYLGFAKKDIETTAIKAFGEMSLEDNKLTSMNTEKNLASDSMSVPTENGDASGDGEMDFMDIVNAANADKMDDSVSTTDEPVSTSSATFQMFPENSAAADHSITKAILTGQFDDAINVCLENERLSDAFMLALCGGPESQKRVQEAYFQKTKVPYGRLLSLIIAGDLKIIVEQADLAHWKEILAVLCNYAKPDDFPTFCELLGLRLEQESQLKDATLCYLAGSKLEHLVHLWSKAQQEEERRAIAAEEGTSAFEIHLDGLTRLIKKVTIFRRAVSYVDSSEKKGEKHTLSVLYTKYLELARVLASEGASELALKYIALVPASFDDATDLKKKIAGPISSTIPTSTTTARPARTKTNFNQPALVVQPQNSTTQAGSSYAPALTPAPTQPALPQSNPVSQRQPPSRSTAVHNPYAPPAGQQQIQQPGAQYQRPADVGTSPYQRSNAQSGYGTPNTNSQGGYGAPNQNLQGGYGAPSTQAGASPYPSFAPPPRISSNGPAILPAAQRKDITPWNDAPDIPLPAPRRATPAVNRPAVVSPFQPAPTPTLQGFGSTPVQPLAPPPKTRSPAPPRAVPSKASIPPSQAPQNAQSRMTSNQYAPQNESRQPSSTKFDNSYAPQPMNNVSHPPAVPPQQAQNFAPPPPPQAAAQSPAAFAPPPKANNPPPKAAGPRTTSVAGKSPVITRGVNLSPEPSRASSPVIEKPSLPAAKYPAGDRSHIPESDKPIEADLTGLLSHLQAVSPDRYKKPLEDAHRRLNILFDQLNNVQLTDGTREQLRIMSVGFRHQDWSRAFTIHGELTNDKMHECRDWILAIKTLVVVGRKAAEERWGTQ